MNSTRNVQYRNDLISLALGSRWHRRIIGIDGTAASFGGSKGGYRLGPGLAGPLWPGEPSLCRRPVRTNERSESAPKEQSLLVLQDGLSVAVRISRPKWSVASDPSTLQLKDGGVEVHRPFTCRSVNDAHTAEKGAPALGGDDTGLCLREPGREAPPNRYSIAAHACGPRICAVSLRCTMNFTRSNGNE